MAMCPVVLLEDLVRDTGGFDERGVRIDIRQFTEDLAEVEDDGAGYRAGRGIGTRSSGRVRGSHVSIMKRRDPRRTT
jgi:hypothetical protein